MPTVTRAGGRPSPEAASPSAPRPSLGPGICRVLVWVADWPPGLGLSQMQTEALVTACGAPP